MTHNLRSMSIADRTGKRILNSFQFHRDFIQQLGINRWLFYQLQARSLLAKRWIGSRHWPRDSRYPLWYRPEASDLSVYQQIYVEREYQCLDHLVSPGLIIDCGANVGYSAAYFLSRFPQSRVIAIEPDSGNYALLQANVAKFGPRVRTIQAGIWSHPCGLKVETSGYRDGREWAVWVRECQAGEQPDVSAISIDQILHESGCDRISILKMDIERSELEVFRANYQGWLSLCDAIVIELHDSECEEIFFQAIQQELFQISRSGELTVCIRDTAGRGSK